MWRVNRPPTRSRILYRHTLRTTVSSKEHVMAKASWQVMFSAVAVSVGAFVFGSHLIVSEHDGIVKAFAREGTSTVLARPLATAPTVMPFGLPDAKAAKAVLNASL